MQTATAIGELNMDQLLDMSSNTQLANFFKGAETVGPDTHLPTFDEAIETCDKISLIGKIIVGTVGLVTGGCGACLCSNELPRHGTPINDRYHINSYNLDIRGSKMTFTVTVVNQDTLIPGKVPETTVLSGPSVGTRRGDVITWKSISYKSRAAWVKQIRRLYHKLPFEFGMSKLNELLYHLADPAVNIRLTFSATNLGMHWSRD